MKQIVKNMPSTRPTRAVNASERTEQENYGHNRGGFSGNLGSVGSFTLLMVQSVRRPWS